MLQYVIALLGILAFGYFIFKKPKIETYVLFVAYGLCLIDAKILPMAYGLVRFFDVVSLIALFIFFKDFISFRIDGEGRIYLILVLLFWIFIILGKINSQFPTNNLQFTYQPFTIFIYCRFVLLYLEKGKVNFYRFVGAFQFSIIVMVLVVFIQVVVGTRFSYLTDLNPNVFNADTGLTRYPGLFNESQTCGQFLALGSFSLLIYKSNISNRKKQLHYLVFFLAIIAVLLAGSRSALGGLVLGGLVVLFFQNAKVKTMAVSVGLVGLISLMLISPKGGGIFSRADSISHDLMFRQSIWEETGGIIEQYPLLGIGLANFQKFIKTYHQDLFLQIEPGGDLIYFHQPENGYLKIIVEHGYIGFFLFLLLVVLPMLKSYVNNRNLLGRKDFIYPISAILAWLVAFNTVYSLIDYRMIIAVAICICLCINNSKKLEIYNKN